MDLNRPLLSSSQRFDTDSPPFRQCKKEQIQRPIKKRRIRIVDGGFEWRNSELQEIERRRGQKSFLVRLFEPKETTSEHIYGNNAIRSTKYKWWNFLPLNMFEQLAPWLKPANFYFLVIAVLQGIKEISTTQGRPSILVPLTFVIAISVIKDASEDYGRYLQDKNKNYAIYKVFRKQKGKYEKTRSKILCVGDIVLVEENQRIPADLILVSSGLSGGSHAYVDTKALDGETNLKVKTVPLCFLPLKEKWREMNRLSFDCACDSPNGDMREWSGEIQITGNGPRSPSLPSRENVSLESLLLSDSTLRNTPWITGVVVYSGEATKIRKNMAGNMLNTRHKESLIFKITKQIFLILLAVQFILCLIGAIVSGWYQSKISEADWYLKSDENPVRYGVLRFFTWIIIVKDFVPISLYVSLELVQLMQAKFMSWDEEMTCKMKGELFQTRVNTSKLNEELAQVDYIFSDKTGTLTQNSMMFKKCIIGTQQYGQLTTEAGIIRDAKLKSQRVSDLMADFKKRENETTEEVKRFLFEEEQRRRHKQTHTSMSHISDSDEDEVELHVQFDERKRLVEVLKEGEIQNNNNAHSTLAREFLYALSLCNSVFPKAKRLKENDNDDDDDDRVQIVVQKQDTRNRDESIAPDAVKKAKVDQKPEGFDDPNSGIIIQLEASSPDETALTAFAQYMGFEIYSREDGLVRLRIRNFDCSDDNPTYHFETFEEVCAIEFNSKRKRMTVLMRAVDENGKRSDELHIYTKGADSVIKELLDKQDSVSKKVYKSLEGYGGESLRTLVIAHSTQKSDWFEQFRSEYDQAHQNQGPAEKGHVDGGCTSECKLCVIENKIERAAQLACLGCTGIEDKLQEGVPDALKALLEAKIHIWVLTGDNVSTAINIAIACNLLQADMENEGRLLVFDKDLSDDYEKLLDEIDNSEDTINQMISEAKSQNNILPTFGLAIHGDVWKLLIESATREIPSYKSGRRSSQIGRLYGGSVSHYKRSQHSSSPSNATFRPQKESLQQTLTRRNNDQLITGSPAHSFNVEDNQSAGEKIKHRTPLQIPLTKQKVNDLTTINDSVEQARLMLKSGRVNLLSRFFDLAEKCQAIVACRLEPKEKADIVELTKIIKPKSTLLAVGDGFNDIIMLKAAHIGVGIQGVEGTGAVAASDYAIGQFRFLTKLLLVHGRLNYRRIAILINYICYKTAMVVWTLFLFGFYSQFSGQMLYLDWAIQLHNILYTAIPILIFAVLDRDLTVETMMENPNIYALTRGKALFSKRFFGEWMLTAFAHAVCCFFISFYAFDHVASPERHGKSYGLISTGLIIYTTVVIVTNFKLLLFFRSWTILHHLSLIFSIVGYIVTMCIFSTSEIFVIGGIDYYYLFFRIIQIPSFYIILIFCVLTCFAIDLLWISLRQVWFPSELDVYCEAERKGRNLKFVKKEALKAKGQFVRQSVFEKLQTPSQSRKQQQHEHSLSHSSTPEEHHLSPPLTLNRNPSIPKIRSVSPLRRSLSDPELHTDTDTDLDENATPLKRIYTAFNFSYSARPSRQFTMPQRRSSAS